MAALMVFWHFESAVFLTNLARMEKAGKFKGEKKREKFHSVELSFLLVLYPLPDNAAGVLGHTFQGKQGAC